MKPHFFIGIDRSDFRLIREKHDLLKAWKPDDAQTHRLPFATERSLCRGKRRNMGISSERKTALFQLSRLQFSFRLLGLGTIIISRH